MAKYIPKILEPILNYTPSSDVENLVSFASKAIRAKIILDRNTRGFQKTETDGGRDVYEHERMSTAEGNDKSHRQTLGKQVGQSNEFSEGYTFETPKNNAKVNNIEKDYISIVDIDFVPSDHNSKRYYAYIQLPFVPRELNYQMGSSFVGIASFGRNNPFYQFTGSEDTLTFTIDWFSDRNDREDVIFNCRWLEALTKADGYIERPHRVKIVWGKDNKLWEDSTWLLVEAPYRLSNFVSGYRGSNGEKISTSMLPQQAMQTVTFKRISNNNRTAKQIIGKVGNRR